MSDYPYQNVYGGLDLVGGWTAEVIRMMRSVLPVPTVSPTCAKSGHKWSAPVIGASPSARVVGCTRCAKRGLVVLETRDVFSAGEENER